MYVHQNDVRQCDCIKYNGTTHCKPIVVYAVAYRIFYRRRGRTFWASLRGVWRRQSPANFLDLVVKLYTIK